jgi:serine/threonine protein kinase
MSLAAGSRIGPYEVLGSLGAGGMGEVYRATDTTLGRQVAIKILPDAFAADPDRLARFEREAKTLVSLNHPHIAAIHGFEKSAGMQALVMELVEGEDLSQRIARGAIPLDEVLPIAKQIAEALEAAHEQGIIHRDLKPANIKIRADGTVKVLDFGLAKATGPSEGDGFSRRQAEAEASALQTITSPAMTQAGMILGTAAYMSPEQARGKAVDKRADIWAFGAVLYEMLTGTRAFPGDDLTDTLAAVVRAEPDWNIIPRDLAPTLLAFLKRSLQKDPKQRVSDIHDMRLAMEGAFDSAAAQAPSASPSSPSRGRLSTALAVAALAIIALAIPAVQHLRETPPAVPPETRLEIVTPSTSQPVSFALSPDGRQIVFVADGEGASRLWLRSLATTIAQPLAGTEGALLPFWSPDSRSIGFFSGTALKRLDLAGGAPQTLATVTSGYGGTWNTDDVILFAPNLTATPLMRVSATGGTATAVTAIASGAIQGHLAPQFLPDGRFLFFVRSASDDTGIYLGTLGGGTPTRLAVSGTGGVYLSSRSAEAVGEGGWLLWLRPGTQTLVAQRLDLATSMLVGEPVTLAEGVGSNGRTHMAASVAATGLLAYRSGDSSPRQLAWVDRSGTARGTVGPQDSTLNNPTVSFDGGRVAVSRGLQGSEDIWLFDGLRESRFTFDAGSERYPVWSGDGARITFSVGQSATLGLYQKRSNGAGGAERVVALDQPTVSTSWSKDGRFMLFNSVDPLTNVDMWAAGTTGDRTPSVFLKTPFREGYGMFSPDGRWVAYQSNETGRPEIYVRPFVPPSESASAAQAAGQWQISAGGGIHPVWRHDGKELYYLNPAGEMMAAPIAITGAAIVPGVPVVLFPTRVAGGGVDAVQARQYDVAPDGRFLINALVESATASITIIQNWNPGTRK